ncbi:ExbD/TolR family protein [Curvivirga aplysinae]|uniref:ExbD/TolR family protein n=1 Tax=Curvivirga aplysinae TaxID=2529852 RepID=UPI0012BB4BE0|nr:biopolymer transporter ExbD [Curvivirga aplysinae]MTI08719.1 biopolymer transporter ExbD [Curvivirga aplysinae]
MKSIAQRTAKKAHFTEENVLPMINVVFLLLIFFMIAGHISASDPVDLEALYSESETKTDDNEVTIFVDQSGLVYFLDNTYKGETFKSPIAHHLTANPNAILRLKVDSNLNGQKMLKLLSIFRELGLTEVTLVTQLPEAGS